MNKLIPLVLLLTFSTFSAFSQPVTFSWATSFAGNPSNSNNISMAKDASGNLYVLGEFTGTRDFGVFSLTASGTLDVFIVKYSPNGNCLWAVKGGSNFSSAAAGKIAVSGNFVYVTGSFSNFIQFGSIAQVSGGAMDIYIACLNTSDGTENWVEKAGGLYGDNGLGICSAAGGGIYICGTFTGPATFGSFTVSSSSAIDNDIYYARYDASGACVWVNRIGGLDYEKATSINQNASGDIYITGSFEGFVSFGPGYFLSSVGYADFYLAKMNSAGTLIWAVNGGSDNNDGGLALSFDQFGNIYCTGAIADTATFGTVTINNGWNVNLLVVKYNSSGTCLWAKTAGNVGADVGYDIATDAGGSSYVAGYITGDADFSGTNVPGVIGVDGFVAKYNDVGALRWVTKIGGVNTEINRAIVLDFNGFCFTAGSFDGNFNVPGVPPLTAPAGLWGVSLMRLGGGVVGLEEPAAGMLSVYPNPASDFIHLNLNFITDAVFTMELISVTGKLVYSKQLGQKENLSDLVINTALLPSGNYFLKLYTSSGDLSKQVTISR